MNKIVDFYRDSYLKFNVNYKPLEGSQIMQVSDGMWFKFKIDDIEEKEDGTYDVITYTLLGVDDVIF